MRQVYLTVVHGRMTIAVLNSPLGPHTYRLATCIMQQNADNPATDDVAVSFSRVSGQEFEIVKKKLFATPEVVSANNAVQEL